jgi:RimJ/RimL family protein N-acetyltransferase
MILETERLVLRPLVQTDAKDIQKHFNDWDIVKFLSSRAVQWPYPEDGAEKFLRNIALPAMEKGDEWFWAITARDNPDELIGVIHLRRDSANGNRSFWLAREHQSKGYMTEALEAVNDFAFDHAGFECLLVKNAHANAASNRLKVKTGAEFIGVVNVAEGHYLDPACRQQEVWHITRENWARHKAEKNALAAVAAALPAAKTPALNDNRRSRRRSGFGFR